MKVTVVTNKQGVVATSHLPAGYKQNGEWAAGLYAGPGQTLHEIDLEDHVLQSTRPEDLHRHVAELVAKRG